MKYLKLSSVLIALFFAVGCGSKNIEKDGNTTQKTTEIQHEANNQEPEESVVNPGGAGLPEGGFMPDGAISGEEYHEYDDSNPKEQYMANDDSEVNENVSEDGDNSYTDNHSENYENATYGDSVKINSLTAIYFDFDRYNIRSDMKEYIKANADFIKEKKIKAVVLQGNTDELGGDEYNTALGLKRAISVRDALILQGLPRNMFSVISYGMHKPVCKEKSDECYAKNRRTDIVKK